MAAESLTLRTFKFLVAHDRLVDHLGALAERHFADDPARWGNGDVEVVLKTLDDLPYVMGLVQQSFERQMGEGGAE